MQRSIGKQKIYTRTYYYSKTFDTVKHEPLVEMLQNLEIADNDTSLLTNLYWYQQATVRCNGEIGKWINIKQGMRQCCVASPHLIILYTEMIMRNIHGMEGFRVRPTVINYLKCDTAIIVRLDQCDSSRTVVE